jgi:hypothetical protein
VTAIETVIEADVAARRVPRLGFRRAQSIAQRWDVGDRDQWFEGLSPADKAAVAGFRRNAGSVSKSRIVYTRGSQR